MCTRREQRIVDCIARGDAEGAVQLMDQHLMIAAPGDEQNLARLLGLT